MATSPGPRYEYETRLRLRQEQLDGLERTSRQVGNARLITALAGVALLIAVLNLPVPAYLLTLPVVVFVGLAIYHEIIARNQELLRRRMRIYESGIHRLAATWAGKGTKGDRFRDANHVYADDLDLFGAGSLFELLCSCRTEGGETKLASWLKAPAERDVVLGRQAAVTELAPKLDLREEWAVLGQGVQATADARKLAAWARTTVDPASTAIRAALFTVSALGPVLFVASGAGWISFTASLVHFLVVAGITAKYREQVERVTSGLESNANDLGVLSSLIQYFEQQPAQAPLLRQLHTKLGTGDSLASTEIGKLRRLVDLLDSAHNMFFALVAFWLLWETQFAFAVAAWRARNGVHVTEWLDALAEMEALLSLSSYAYENPQAPFPDLDPAGQTFDATDLCHPLVPHAVGNDVHLTPAKRLLIVSGSNMSGKSTLLRSVGLNTVLAWAGAPVRAQRLRLSQLTLGASFRTVDSVQEGRSRFYAEVLRLRQITELTQAGRPVMFLLDELLSGTNSHDRVQGSEMLLRGLLERGAIGLVTTHDLALTQLAEGLPGSVNVHFSDQFKDGEMHFDYHMKPGVVNHSNALELMRSVGLLQ
jgi:DNA mismatch repair ATPase MutS